MTAAPLHLLQSLLHAAPCNPADVAVMAPGRAPLSHQMLRDHGERIGRTLRDAGIGSRDRVAVVLPNGPEMATGFLAVAAHAACAPLNPAYRREDFDFYFDDLGPAAVILPQGLHCPAREAAAARAMPVLELSVQPHDPAGVFALTVDGGLRGPAAPRRAEREDEALVLHTSGTTSRPKMVPLTQRNLCTSAQNIRRALALTAADRCLTVMPLFHIHGLIAAVLSPLAAGGSIVCPPGMDVARFFGWLDEFAPTWYTAVPTMHQAILSQAHQHRRSIESNRLRFIRSQPTVMRELEETFGAPVLEAYGMTEASHQIASNPLPPAMRKPGSVGIQQGLEFGIRREQGRVQRASSGITPVGEIVIRGENVTAGYVNNPSANQDGFVDGWFRTGDLGYIDADGYLFLSGRSKEIINRGGEKISPREIEEALLEHPAVAQAIAFAMPHATLGEDVAAALVARAGQQIDEAAMRAFARERLAPFKVPARVVQLSELPKGPTGKVQRIGLAAKLGLTAATVGAPVSAAPATPTEETLAGIWRDVLRVERVGRLDEFLLLGGDSLMAAVAIERVRDAFGLELPVTCFVEHTTVAELAAHIDGKRAARSTGSRVLLRIAAGGGGAPFFWAHGVGGGVFEYLPLSRTLGSDRPVYGLTVDWNRVESPGRLTLETIAARCVAEMRAVQPRGPYFVGGYCRAAWLALEIVRQIESEGDTVGLLVVLDDVLSEQTASSPRGFRSLPAFARNVPAWLQHEMVGRGPLDLSRRVAGKFRKIGGQRIAKRNGGALDIRERLGCWHISDEQLPLLEAHNAAFNDYAPRPCAAPIAMLLPNTAPLGGPWPSKRGDAWSRLTRTGFTRHFVDGTHWTMLLDPFAAGVGAQVQRCVAQVEREEAAVHGSDDRQQPARAAGRAASAFRHREVNA